MDPGFDQLDLIRPLVDAALAEDVGTGDVTTAATVPEGTQAEGEILAREAGSICGLPVAREVFHRLDSDLLFEADVEEGGAVKSGDRVARVRGKARSILTAERTALNFLQHLSGIATQVERATRVLAGTPTRLLDTRKTLPGMRLLAKYAVRCGGGMNHRMGLHDMVLIKENHIAAAGGVTSAIRRARKMHPSLPLEVEVTTMAELAEALDAGPDRVLLDNFEPEAVARAVTRIQRWAKASEKTRPEVELSGGITPETIRSYARQGVDFISSGAITHSAPALDLSLELRLLPHTPNREDR